MATAPCRFTCTFSKAILAIVFLAFFAAPIHAVTVSVHNLPSLLDQSQELEADVFLECSGCGDSYLRGVFYPDGTKYFGLTQNNQGQWIGTVSDKTQYFKVVQGDLSEGSWSGKLKVKPDAGDSSYSGPGNYFFKVGRYTAGGSATWSNEASLSISGPTNTPTPANTSTKSPTQVSQATSTPIPPAASTPVPTKKSIPTKTPTPKKFPTPLATESAVLGESLIASAAATPSGGLQAVIPAVVSLLLVAAGLAIIAGVLVWKKRKLSL